MGQLGINHVESKVGTFLEWQKVLKEDQKLQEALIIHIVYEKRKMLKKVKSTMLKE